MIQPCCKDMKLMRANGDAWCQCGHRWYLVDLVELVNALLEPPVTVVPAGACLAGLDLSKMGPIMTYDGPPEAVGSMVSPHGLKDAVESFVMDTQNHNGSLPEPPPPPHLTPRKRGRK